MLPIHIGTRIFSCILGSLLLIISVSAPAFTNIRPSGLVLSIVTAPRVSTVGTARSIFVHGAAGVATFDESSIATNGTLVIRMAPEIIGLLASPLVLTYTPRNVGSLRVILRLADGSTTETQMETVAGSRSSFNLDGMWFDPATNGSGVAFNHSANSDAIFGTWFLYGPQTDLKPNDSTRWYSLQNMHWTQGATALVGIAYEPRANDLKPPCVAGDDCPRPAALKPVGTVSVSIIDANNLRVEAFDQYGRLAFVSSLKRLTF